MFWDGERWVPEKGPVIRSKRPASRNRLQRWLVAMPILFLVAALIVPVVSTEAATYHTRVVVSGVAEPGGLVTLTGSGTRPGGYLQARLDRASTRLGLIRVDRRGRFSVQLRLPSTTTPGTHLVTIGRVSYGRLATASIRSTRLLAQTTILSVKVNVKRKGGGSTSAPPAPANTVQAASPAPDPTAAPAPTPSGIAVPASIDATGTTNVSAALNAWLATVPDGSTIVFKAGGIYQVQPGVRLTSRHNLVLEGNGATIKNVGWERSALGLLGGDHITVRNLTLLGDNPDAGTANAYHSGGQEGSAGVWLKGVSNIELANVTISGAWGDCLFVGSGATGWSDTVSFHDSTCRLNGRQGVVVNAGRNVTIQRVNFDQIALYVLDIEPDYVDEGAYNVRFIDNTVGTYTVDTHWDCLFVAADGLAGSSVNGLTISGNAVAGNPHGYNGKACGLNSDISVSRRQNVVFTNNTASLSVAGPVLLFSHVDGLTVTGNAQPLKSGVLVSITDSTGVTYR